MKRMALAVGVLVALTLSVLIGRWWASTTGAPAPQSAAGARKILYWRAPMDPNFRSDRPGKSPMGMDLVPVYADASEPGMVTIDPRIVNSLGVRVEKAHIGTLSRRVETVGYVSYDEDTIHQVNTRVDGWIEALGVKAVGDPVARGDVLFELYSPTLVNAENEYVTSIEGGSASLQQSSRERLSALGVADSEIRRLSKERTVTSRVSRYAQRDGVVVQLGVRSGTYVTPATTVMSIADRDPVWVLAEVFERQSAWIESGQRAEIELDYLPGMRWQGTVDYVYPELDPTTRTLKARLRLSNDRAVLRPNMFARVTIFAGDTGPVVNVPRAALIRGGTEDRVVIALGDGRFRSQVVTVGIESGDRVEIASGLSADDRVVTSAQFLIDSESNVDAALARLDGTPASTPAGEVDAGDRRK